MKFFKFSLVYIFFIWLRFKVFIIKNDAKDIVFFLWLYHYIL